MRKQILSGASKLIAALQKAHQDWTDLETHQKVIRIYTWSMVLSMVTLPWVGAKYYERNTPSDDPETRAHQAYESGFSSGSFEGRDPGYTAGYVAGYTFGKSEEYIPGAQPEVDDPYVNPDDIVYSSYFECTNREEYASGFVEGYTVAYRDGYLDGYITGSTTAYSQAKGF